MFKDSLLFSIFAGKGFSEVADWLRVQESLKVGVGSWLVCRVLGLVVVGKRNLAHELNGKKIN